MRFLLACILATLCATANAQYYNSLTGRQFGNMYAANADRIMTQMVQQSGYAAMRASIEAASKKQAGGGGGTAAAQAPAALANAAYKFPITASDFKPAGPRRAPEQLAESATNPKDRQDIAKAGRDMHRAIEGMADFRKNNVAAAMALLVGVSVQVLKGVELTNAQSVELMHGLNDQLASLDGFKALSAEDRTRMYDAFIVIGGFIAGIAQAGAETRNRELQEQARAMSRDALARFGVKA